MSASTLVRSATATIDGYEKGLRIYDINGFSYLAPYVTANVNLWPHTLALIANPDTLAGLTATQRNWLTERRVRRRVTLHRSHRRRP